MFDTKSDFALNKFDKDAIVCPSATGVHIRLTREDFASEEDFLRWKIWSDGDYHDIEKAGRGYYDYCISLSEAGNTGISAEDIFIAPLLEAEQEERRAALLRQVKGLLTETQYRRLWMYRVKGIKPPQGVFLFSIRFPAQSPSPLKPTAPQPTPRTGSPTGTAGQKRPPKLPAKRTRQWGKPTTPR